MARLLCLPVLLALLMLLTVVSVSTAFPGYYTIPDEDSASKRGNRHMMAHGPMALDIERGMICVINYI